MSDLISKEAVLEWLNDEIDLSSGRDQILKADKWAYQLVKKEIERGAFDVQAVALSPQSEKVVE